MKTLLSIAIYESMFYIELFVNVCPGKVFLYDIIIIVIIIILIIIIMIVVEIPSCMFQGGGWDTLQTRNNQTFQSP